MSAADRMGATQRETPPPEVPLSSCTDPVWKPVTFANPTPYIYIYIYIYI